MFLSSLFWKGLTKGWVYYHIKFWTRLLSHIKDDPEQSSIHLHDCLHYHIHACGVNREKIRGKILNL